MIGVAREDRFWAKVNMLGKHWMWTGGVSSGYGLFSWRENGKVLHRGAHVMAYELCIGAVPDGLTVDHLCRIKLCCNPACLEPVTMRVNTLRGTSPVAINATKTECSRGHKLEGANLRIKQGRYGPQRICRKCDYIYTKNARAKRRRSSLV